MMGELSDLLLRRYLVRDLLWCGACGLPWEPLLLRPMSRYYACPNKACPHPAMPAKIIEQRVWSRFVSLQGATIQPVPRERRHDLLRRGLKRVVIDNGTLAMWFDWW